MKLQFKVTGAKDIVSDLRDAKKRFVEDTEEEIVKTLNGIKANVEARVPRDTGNLASSFKVEGKGLEYSLYTDENYAGYLEFGTRSRFEKGMSAEWQEEATKFRNTSKGDWKQAKENLTAWAKRKGIPDNEIPSVIFAIMRDGIRSPTMNPKPFFRPSVNEGIAGIESRLDNLYQAELDRI